MTAIPGISTERVTQFLFAEADLLDSRRLYDWLALLTPDIDYRVPVRLTRERGPKSREFSDKSFHMIEDFDSIKGRISRLDSEFAWSEDPPVRMRRFVANVQIRSEAQDGSAEIEVTSNLLLFRARADEPPDLLSGQRLDRLRLVGGELRICRREILLDHTWLPVENLAMFL